MRDLSVARAWLIGAAALLIAFGYRLGRPPLLDDPNDAQYAEVAREMLEAGEWITPQLNGTIFLNKPPLLYWLVAASYSLFGVNEAAARLPGVLATLLTCLIAYHLALRLYDRRTGYLAALLYATMSATWIESRFVRPDAVLAAAVSATLCAFVAALDSRGRRRRRAVLALYAALAAGVLAKGAVAIVLPALPIAAVLLRERRPNVLRSMLAPGGLALFALLVAPWHTVVSLRHPGFAWDYIVHQHLLFFLDKKLPRDSIPIALGPFWAATLGRLFPWTLFLPLAIYRLARPAAGNDCGRARLLLAAWAGGTLLFFSAAVSRLEHYAIPALPGAAIVIAAALRTCERREQRWQVALHLLALGGALAAGFVLVPRLLRADEMLGASALPVIASWVFSALTLGALAAAAVTWVSVRWAVPALGAAALLVIPLVHRGLTVFAGQNSSAPLAALIPPQERERAAVVCLAPVEYQSCAGINFYLRRRIYILRPDGFVEPTYLLPHRDELFIDEPTLAELWSTQHVYLIGSGNPNTTVLSSEPPQPAGSRWVIDSGPP